MVVSQGSVSADEPLCTVGRVQRGSEMREGSQGCVCGAFLSVLEKVAASQELNVANQQVETPKCVWRRWRRLAAYQSAYLLKLGPFISTPLSWRSSSTSCTLGSFLSGPLDSHRAALCCKNTRTVRQEHREVVYYFQLSIDTRSQPCGLSM